VIGNGLVTEYNPQINVLIDKSDGRGSLGRLRTFGRMILKMELMKIFAHLFMVYLMRQCGI
jgi:hypothetical protein